MKKFTLLALTFTLIFQVMQAQQKFDSLAYLQTFRRYLPPFSFELDTTPPARNVLTDAEKIHGLSQVWSSARFNFANFDLVPRLNWDSAYRSFIPRVLATGDLLSYYGELKKFNQLLHDGHSRVMEPLYYFFQKGVVPFVFEYIDGKVVLASILRVEPEYTKAQIGWVVTTVNGIPVQEYIQKEVSPYLHFSTPQDSMARIYRYELLTGSRSESVEVGFMTATGKAVVERFKRLPWNYDTVPVRFSVLPENIGYVVISSFGTEQTVKLFDSLFPQISKTKALIIDIRGNGGGNSNNGFEILGFLLDKPFKTNYSVLHQYRPSQRAWGDEPVSLQINSNDWKPYRHKLYSKPVMVVCGPATYSAAEDFLGAYKTSGRGKIVGSPTGGSTGQPLGYLLPGGGLGFICTKRDYMSDGTEFVGIGIQPDIPVRPTLQGLQEGRDEMLERAVTEIRKELR